MYLTQRTRSIPIVLIFLSSTFLPFGQEVSLAQRARPIPIEISPVLRDLNNCYILLLNSPQPLENTGFVADELSLIFSLVLYLPISVYEL